MAIKQAHLTLKVDVSRVNRAMRETVTALEQFSRAFKRLEVTPGDRHIDRICKEILAGVPGRAPELRLLVASDLAQVLDR